MAFLYNFNYNDECSDFHFGPFYFSFLQTSCLFTNILSMSVLKISEVSQWHTAQSKIQVFKNLAESFPKNTCKWCKWWKHDTFVNDKYQDSSWKYQLFWLFAILIPGDSDLSETSKKKLCLKSSILDVWLGSEYTSECKYNTWNSAKNIAFDDEREMKDWMWIPSVTILFNMLVLRLRVTKIRG